MGLERVSAVRDRRWVWHRGFPIITVGGTNGKGSVCAMLEAILSSAGYRVGCTRRPICCATTSVCGSTRREVDDARSGAGIRARRGRARGGLR